MAATRQARTRPGHLAWTKSAVARCGPAAPTRWLRRDSSGPSGRPIRRATPGTAASRSKNPAGMEPKLPPSVYRHAYSSAEACRWLRPRRNTETRQPLVCNFRRPWTTTTGGGSRTSPDDGSNWPERTNWTGRNIWRLPNEGATAKAVRRQVDAIARLRLGSQPPPRFLRWLRWRTETGRRCCVWVSKVAHRAHVCREADAAAVTQSCATGRHIWHREPDKAAFEI
jgi:hypothetical protein